jgi:hypothetical protein
MICQVHHNCAAKMEENELLVLGQVICLNKIQREQNFWPDANTIDRLDAFVLLMLHLEEPHYRGQRDYQSQDSASTISPEQGKGLSDKRTH